MSYEEISILECAQKTQIIGELTPKLTYYSKVLKQPEAVPLLVIAKDYEIRMRKFVRILKQLGICYKLHNYWLLQKEYINCGYTISRMRQSKSEQTMFVTLWTQEGRLFLYETLKYRIGLLPIEERAELPSDEERKKWIFTKRGDDEE